MSLLIMTKKRIIYTVNKFPFIPIFYKNIEKVETFPLPNPSYNISEQNGRPYFYPGATVRKTPTSEHGVKP
jgi:hypothetical protein